MYAQFSTYKIFELLELLYEPGFKRRNKGGALILNTQISGASLF